MSQETTLNHPETADTVRPMTGTPILEEGEVNLLDVAHLLRQKKRLIFQFALVAAILTAIVVFGLMSPMYTAEAVFLPPQTSPGSSMAALASQLGPMGAVGALSGLKSPGDVYLGILGSRTIADKLIEKFDLQKVYKKQKHSDVVSKLKKRSTFTSEKNGLITIQVEDHDPKRAADMANAYLDALREQNGHLALTDAAQRRLFFEEQLDREKNALSEAEVELKKTEERTGMIAPVGQAEIEIESMAQIGAQITNLQVELAAMKQGATDQNPEVVRLQTQIAGLQHQLQSRQNDSAKRQPGDVEPPTSKVPELALEFVRRQRDVKYHEVLFELIAKQYETARLDESRDAPLLQVVDNAVVPDKPSSIPRLVMVLGGALVGAFFACGWIILGRYIESLRQNQPGALVQ